MADKAERIRIINDTLEQCRTNPRLAEAVRASIQGQEIHWQPDCLPLNALRRWEHTRLVLSRARTLEAAGKYAAAGKKTCILNFASSVTPGGGVLRGAGAQEESLCRICTLYPALADESAAAFYISHRDAIQRSEMGWENRDDCIFTPGVITIREDTFDCKPLAEEDWFSVDVITCAAPDQRFAYGRSSAEEISALFERRWTRILTIAANHGAEAVILGAFGCGVFANPPALAARTAAKACAAFDGYFETIEFAVFTSSFDSDNYTAFAAIPGLS